MKTIKQAVIDIGGSDVLDDTIQLKGGGELYIDPNWRPTFHAKIKGKIAFVCASLPDVKVGDVVYFPYTLADTANLKMINGNFYLLIDASELFCNINTDGHVFMLNDYIFVEPQVIQTNKETVAKLAAMDVTCEPAYEKSMKRGHVRHSNGGDMNGWEVAFNQREAFENNIEGKDLYVMKHYDCDRIDDMLAKI